MPTINYFKNMTEEQLFNIGDFIGSTTEVITHKAPNKIIVSCLPKNVGYFEDENFNVSVFEYTDILLSAYDVEQKTISTFNNYYSKDKNMLIRKSTHEQTYQANEEELEELTNHYRAYMGRIFPDYERKALEHDMWRLYRAIKQLEQIIQTQNSSQNQSLILELQKAKTKLEEIKTKLANLTTAEMQ